MKTISRPLLKLDAEVTQTAGTALLAITRLLRNNAIEKEDVDDGRPFLNAFTEDGLFAALELISNTVGQVSARLERLAKEVSDD